MRKVLAGQAVQRTWVKGHEVLVAELANSVEQKCDTAAQVDHRAMEMMDTVLPPVSDALISEERCFGIGTSQRNSHLGATGAFPTH